MSEPLSNPVRRRGDSSIDFDYYRTLALIERSKVIAATANLARSAAARWLGRRDRSNP